MKQGAGRSTLSDSRASGLQGAEGSPYLVGPILRACEVLKAYKTEGETLFLRDLVSRTGLNKTTVFRAAETLVAGGLLRRSENGRYAATMTPCRQRRFRIGYGSMTSRSLFGQDVSESLRVTASEMQIELVEVDNQMNGRVAVANAERLIREKVDLVIEFQVCHRAAQKVSARFSEAGIPMIAVHTPHPGATFFGGNNYIAGRIGGRALASWARHAWQGRADRLLLLGHTAAGPFTNARLTGMAAGLSESQVYMSADSCVHLDCKGGYTEAVDVIFDFLARSGSRRFLVGAINDSVALGALRAFKEAGRDDACAIMSQNGTLAARNELRRKGSRLVGSVAFYPEKYGDHLVPLAVSMLTQKSTSRAYFMKHELISASNVDEFYPNDALNSSPDPESMLFGRYH